MVIVKLIWRVMRRVIKDLSVKRVFILTGYVSHADISKIESFGIDGKFIK